MTSGSLQSVLTFIRDEGDVPAGDPDFGPEVDLFDYGYLDSFGLVRLIEWGQTTFGVDLGNADFHAELRSPARIAAWIDEHRAAGP